MQYRKGRKVFITELFKKRMLDRLGEIGKTQQWLEQELGLAKGSVHRLLNSQQSSVIVDPICKLLDIPPPFDHPDPMVCEMVELFYSAKDSKKAAYLALLRSETDNTK